jgi:hypothetical protein
MVTRAELGEAIVRLRDGAEGDRAERAGDIELVCLALERYLVGEGRVKGFDKRSYMRSYMAEYRAKRRDGRSKAGVRRKKR